MAQLVRKSIFATIRQGDYIFWQCKHTYYKGRWVGGGKKSPYFPSTAQFTGKIFVHIIRLIRKGYAGYLGPQAKRNIRKENMEKSRNTKRLRYWKLFMTYLATNFCSKSCPREGPKSQLHEFELPQWGISPPAIVFVTINISIVP